MATKTIYLEKKTEKILEQYANDNNLTLSKAINTIIQGKVLNKVEKPLNSPKIEIKKPAEVSEHKKEIKQKYKGFRAPSNW